MKLEETTFGVQTTTRYKRKRYKRRRSKKLRYVLAGICLFLVALTIGLSAIGYPALNGRYHQDLALAHTGAQELQVATALLQTIQRDPFNTKAVADAQHNFTDALTIFTRLNADLSLVPDALTVVPNYGTPLSAAKHLVPLAMEVAQAGLAGCSIVSTMASSFHDPLSSALIQPGNAASRLPPVSRAERSKAQGLNMSDLALLDHNLQQIKLVLTQAVQQVNQLQPEDLQVDPRLGKLVTEFHTRLPLIQQGIDQAEAFFSVAPMILGVDQPAYYLVEILDSTELRPGGGFIGNFGIASFSGGRVASADVIDTYLLDYGFARTHKVSFPSDYSWFNLTRQWGLRDSNLNADFPASARNAEMLYQLEGGKHSLAGVIAITPALMESVLALTGPIAVPEYHETITAQNLIDRIHYHQLIEEAKGGDVPSADGYSSVRKHFTALLGEYFLARLHSLPGSMLPTLLQTLTDAVHTKDMQIYFNATAAEKTLQFYHIDGSIQSPAGDGVFVVDANITPNKADRYLVTTINDQVTIDNSGTATHHTLIKFTWTTPGLRAIDFYGSTRYSDYLRVYVPSNSVLLSQAGWLPNDAGIAFGRKFWGGYGHVNYPNTGTITLTWSVAGAAHKDAQGLKGWHYMYLIQHQAGAQQKMFLQVALAPCAAIVDKSTGVVAEGKHNAYLAQALTQDTGVSIDYTC